MVSKASPLEASADLRSQLTGLFLVTEDDFGIATLMIEALQQRGADAILISRSILQDADGIPEHLSQLIPANGSVRGLIHLAGLVTLPLPTTFDQWQIWSQIQVRSLFQLLQIYGIDLQQQSGLVYAASLLGGTFGRNSIGSQQESQSGLALAGGCSGMLKTLTLEWENVQAKALDFSSQYSPVDIVELIIQEILHPDSNVEIGYFDQQRWTFHPLRQDLVPNVAAASCQPSPDWVVLCMGGARGITAEVLDEIACPGMTIIVVGRSALDEPEPECVQGIEDLAQLRKALIQATQQQRTTFTPVQIEQQVKRIQRHRSMQATLNHFQLRGIQVEYHTVDVKDEPVFTSFLTDIYKRYGRIDAVIQGAGIIQDKLILNKTLPSFDQVFQTKVNSTFLLCQHLCPESLKLVILFASVAGRTGNRGQVDYAAANEVLNRMAWWMRSQWPQTRVMSINWGPWEGTGMASEAINRQFRDRGVIPIPIASGRAFITQELAYGNNNDIELITGYFNTDQSHPVKTAIDRSPSISISPASTLPFISTPCSVPPSGRDTLYHDVSLNTHPYLNDHRIDQIPVLPAAAVLELMAEFVQSLWPDWMVTTVEDLRVLKGITLQASQTKQICLQAEPVTQAEDVLRITVKVIDPITQVLFYRANFLLSFHSLPTSKVTDLPPLAAASPLTVQSAYQQYCFHRGLFQVLTAIPGLNQQGVDADVQPSQPQAWLNLPATHPAKAWLFDPGIVDATLQLALIWTHIHGDMGGLPARFGRITRYSVQDNDFQQLDKLKIALRVRYFIAPKMIFDAWIMDRHHNLIFKLDRMETTCSKALNRLTAKTNADKHE